VREDTTAAAPPNSVMKSRLFMRLSRQHLFD
jgi:hypothetical protein